MQQEEFSFGTAPAARAHLKLAASPRDAWDGAIRDWFERNAASAWRHARPAVVLVPHRTHAHWLKAQLLDAGLSHLGIRFVTPAGLRESLSKSSTHQVPLREHLRLLLAIAAEESQNANSDTDHLAAKAVTRAPDHLLRALDKLDAAGWTVDALQLAALQQIVGRFREYVSACGFDLAAQVDRALFIAARSQPPIFEDLLVCNFDGAHWPLWFLLRAAVESAERATVVLPDPREEARNIDSLWVGSWEEHFGEAIPVGGAANERKTADRIFLIGLDATEQAEAVAQLSLQFLAEKSCTRLGIVFPRAGALSRLVAGALQLLEIPHNDAIGYGSPGLFETSEWKSWLRLQLSPRLNLLTGFLRSLPPQSEVLQHASVNPIERLLRKAHADVLIDDLGVLRQFCRESSSNGAREVAEALGGIDLLPGRATLPQFLRATERALLKLEWSERWDEIARLSADWPDRIAAEIPRSLFLRWLDEIASSFHADRDASGDHPYARVQLMTISQAEAQEWSHLILAGLNEGDWPPTPAGDFPREEEIESYNAGIRRLNKRASEQGRHGEGHVAVRDGHTVYLGPAERRQIALRQFTGLVESTTETVALAASLVNEAEPERLRNPSELFTRLYFEVHDDALTEATLRRLRQKTRKWLSTGSPKSMSDKADTPEIAQTRIAYDARRRADLPSGEYDFAFKEGTSSAVHRLSVSEFENLLSAPALVWMDKFLGVEAAEDDSGAWITSTGQWVHHWLASLAPGEARLFAAKPGAQEIDERVRIAAESKREAVVRLCKIAGKVPPDWWFSGWENARALSRQLGARLATVDGWQWVAAEWKIDPDEPIRAGATTLLTRGRIDLLLAQGDRPPGDLAIDHLWIIDFKTGAKKSLASSKRPDADKRKAAVRKSLINRDALQLALYGLAARHFGATNVFLGLISPIIRPVEPQLAADELAAEEDIFAELARMQQTGIFGMLGPIRSRFGYTADYPLATLAIDPYVLTEKWELTHPSLAKDEEEYGW